MNSFERVKGLIGESALNKLQNSHIAVFGVGGVGGSALEALVRSGVGIITIVDNDTVSESNINRQIIANIITVGKLKTEVWENRLKEINPNVKVNAINLFYLPETADKIDLSAFDYVIDAVDTVSAKIALIERAKALNVPIISSMGTAGKLNPTCLKVAFIKDTSGCPLAKVVRKQLKDRGITDVKVVYSTEKAFGEINTNGSKNVPSSMTFVPNTAGLIIASEVVKDLTAGLI